VFQIPENPDEVWKTALGFWDWCSVVCYEYRTALVQVQFCSRSPNERQGRILAPALEGMQRFFAASGAKSI